MLLTILLTIYCTLMYVVGFKLFKMKIGGESLLAFICWMISPILVPFVYLVLLLHDDLEL